MVSYFRMVIQAAYDNSFRDSFADPKKTIDKILTHAQLLFEHKSLGTKLEFEILDYKPVDGSFPPDVNKL